MKKTKKAIKALLLTALITSAFNCTTYAAQNPSFSDVPATHWSYDAVNSLAKAGLVEGMGDGTFRGDRAMSRYEMAILVSKTIDQYKKADAVQKASIDKLSAEFASELNSLGARIAKVETKTNTWVSGETRIRAMGDSPSKNMPARLSHADKFDFRQRIAFKGNINDSWSWAGRLSSDGRTKFGTLDGTFGADIKLDQANVTAKNILGLDTVRVGRSALDFFSHGMIGGPGNKDGLLVVKKIDDVKFTGWTGNVKGITSSGNTADNSGFTTGQLDFKVNKVNVKTGYYWGDFKGDSNNLNVSAGKSFNTSQGFLVGFDTKLGKDLLLFGDYVGSKLNGNVGIANNPKGYMVQLTNSKLPIAYQVMGMVNPAKTGSDAWMVQYRSIDPGAFVPGSGNFDTVAVTNIAPINFYTKGSDNVNALFLAYSKVVAKNVVASLEFQDLKIKNTAAANLTAPGTDKTYQAKIEVYY